MSELANGLPTKNRLAISELSELSVTHVAARRGATAALDGVVRTTLGVALPTSPRAVESAGVMIIWAGPDQWLIVQRREGNKDASEQLATSFRELASVVDVSDSRTIFRIAQPRPTDALIRRMGIDFQDDVFRPGDVAITHVSHLGVMVWRLPDGGGYDFACARTYSRDFLDWLSKV